MPFQTYSRRLRCIPRLKQVIQHFIEHQFPLKPPPKQPIEKRVGPSAIASAAPDTVHLRHRQSANNAPNLSEAPSQVAEKPGDSAVIDAFGPPAFSIDRQESRQLDSMPTPAELVSERLHEQDSSYQSPHTPKEQAAAKVSYLQLGKRLAADQLGM